MKRTPVIDLSDVSVDDQDKLLDAAALDSSWMIEVFSPGVEEFHTVCIHFQDCDPSEFRDLLRSLYIEPKERVMLGKLYDADYALQKTNFEVLGQTARVFRVNATRPVDL